MNIRNAYDNGRAFREGKIRAQILKVTLSQRKRPTLSGHLERYFVRNYRGALPENRMEFLHTMYEWLNRQ
jgi:hypothetical protein